MLIANAYMHNLRCVQNMHTEYTYSYALEFIRDGNKK